ncbi:MAG: hypothetical protein M1820_000673 [Bogoriella megaspora]|nr:MAG: hypothetical protein M1820_000673 [Bogoriella megaspora]
MSWFGASKQAEKSETPLPDDGFGNTVIADGNDLYTTEEGGNTSKVTYQEASGAPVETKSPLGYSVGWAAIFCLNLNQMVGTGVFSTPSSVLEGAGSIGLALFYWVIGFVIAAATLAVYLEFAAYFPSRSGSEVVYLEQAYLRPRYFFPTVFAMQTVILSFSSSNAIVLAQYLFRMAGSTPTAWQQKGVAVASYTIACLFLVFSTRWSLRLANLLGFVKLATLVFVAITGLVVLGGHTSVKDPKANFRDSFSGTSDATAYGATNAMVKVIFAYEGYSNAFNVVNEVKDPVKTLRRSAPISLLAVAILYILANIAYFAAASKEDILASKQTAASILFQNVFGETSAKGLNFLVVLSAFGNLVAVLIGQSRVIRECGRQGVLPWTGFWTSTRPFGTPLGPYFVKWALTVIMILAPPAGDAFNFIVDLGVYPYTLFNFALAVGLFVLRWRRKRVGLPTADFRAWSIAVSFSIVANLYLVIMPWYPPDTGADGGDVSFWYGTYVATGLGIIALCAVYYWVWIKLLPKLGGYQMRQELIELDNGEQTHKLVKVANSDVARWDSEHDVTGRTVRQRVGYGEEKPAE